MCAYNVIKRCEDRLSTPVAMLMNGLLDGNTTVMNDTQISQDAVWGIVFELHRIAPSLLTTVIGNVASALQVEVRALDIFTISSTDAISKLASLVAGGRPPPPRR